MVLMSFEAPVFDRSLKLEECISKIALHNDKNAVTELYNQTKSAVYGYILSVMKNAHDSEDILHDVYVSVIKNAGKYKPQGKPMAWMFTIAKNLVYMKLRSRKNEQDISEFEWGSMTKTPDLTSEDKIVLYSAMKELSEEEYRIVVLRIAGGLKNREISDIMELPLSTVLSKYSRALKKLKKILERADENEQYSN